MLIVNLKNKQSIKKLFLIRKLKCPKYFNSIILIFCLRIKNRVDCIDLSEYTLSKNDIRHLCKALKHQKTVTNLDLSYQKIDDEMADIIAEMLKSNPTLAQVNLSNNKITHKSSLSLSEVLIDNKNLTKLNLSKNRLGSRGIKTLLSTIGNSRHRNMSKIDLNISNNGMPESEYKRLWGNAIFKNGNNLFKEKNKILTEENKFLKASLPPAPILYDFSLKKILGTATAVIFAGAYFYHAYSKKFYALDIYQ